MQNNKTKIYIFDKDGTICRSKSGKKFINSVEDQELIPGVKEKIEQLQSNSHKIAIASNQGGVAFGHMSIRDASQIMTDAKDLVGADVAIYCPYHPDGTVEYFKLDSIYRKPNPGMIFECVRFICNLDKLGADRVIFIGDRPEDQEAAQRAGVQFEWASDFFEGWGR